MPTRPSAADALAPLAPWIVVGWLTGVCLLSVRFLAGYFAARRLARKNTRRLAAVFEQRLTELGRRLGVRRAVRLLESTLVRVPTAIGIVRPVILVPAGIATGMPSDQLDSLLAHELAHIRRADSLVNLVQALVETLLFYHPAVWWVSGRVRTERENACDDLAVEATGNAVAYARALLELAERRRAVPLLAVAASGGHLWNRIQRLVDPARPEASASPRWLAGGLVLTAVLALGAAARVPDPPTSATTSVASVASVAPVAPVAPAAPAVPIAPTAPTAPPEPRASQPKTKAQTPPADASSAPRGLLSPDDLVAFRIHGVTPEFVGEIVALGYTKASPDELVAMRIHGVSSDYVREMTAIFGKLPLERYVEFRIHGLNPESLRQLEGLFGKLSADDALSMRIHGVDAAYVSGFREAGFAALTADDVVSLRIHGATPEFARAMRAQGFTALSPDDLVAFRIHGVTPEYVSAIRGLGYNALTPDEVTAFRIHGLSASSIQRFQSTRRREALTRRARR